MMQLTDQLGRVVQLSQYPLRIISVVPSLTELLFDLGLREQIAGRTKFCIHPGDFLASVTKIGGTKNINISKILSLQPDLIIANKEENVAEQIEELSHHTQVYVSNINTLEDALEAIRHISILTQTEKVADEICSSILHQFKSLDHSLTQDPLIPVCYLIWKEPFITIGSNTFIHDMLKRAGFRNVFEALTRYPAVTLEQIIEAQPKYLFLSSEPYPFSVRHISELTGALHKNDITPIVVDGEMFSWYGSRLKMSSTYFKDFNKILLSGALPHDNVFLHT